MAGKKRRTATASRLTIAHYEQAWKFYLASKTPSQICSLVGITRAQLHQLVHEGLPKRGDVPAQPSFHLLLSEQVAKARVAGVEAAMEVSVRGVRVLSEAFANAERAQTLATMLLEFQKERIEEELSKPKDKRQDLHNVVFTERTLRLLRTLYRYADLRGPALAFRSIYNAHATDAPAQHEDLPKGTIDVEAQDKLPAAIAMLEEVGGSQADVMRAEMARQLEGWTEEEMLAYATTGAEPAKA